MIRQLFKCIIASGTGLAILNELDSIKYKNTSKGL